MPYYPYYSGQEEPPLSQTDPLAYTRAVLRYARIGPNALARAYGCSIATVIRLLTSPHTVPEENRQRFRAAVRRLGYQGNSALLFRVPDPRAASPFPVFDAPERARRRAELLTWIRARYQTVTGFARVCGLPSVRRLFGTWTTSETTRASLILFLQQEGCPVPWVRSLIDIADKRGRIIGPHWRLRQRGLLEEA